ncbi:MAG: hypothetical protein AB8G22_05660 [Saprospiraceae bacterium]
MIDNSSSRREIKKSTEEKSTKKFDNKVFKYLRIFERDELIAVRRFIISPYFNESEAVINLFQHVRRFHDGGYTSHRLKSEVVFSHLFPDEAYNHRKLINLYSDLAVLLEKYIAVNELESDAMTKRKVLMDAYGKRRQFEFFEKEIEKGMKIVNKDNTKNIFYYQDRIFLNTVMYQYPLIEQFKKDSERLPNLLKDLNEYYYLMKLRYTAYYLNDAVTFRGFEEEKSLLDELNLMQKLVDTSDNQLIIFYAKLINLLKTPFQIDNFQEVIDFFIKNIYLFSHEELRAAYLVLLNIITGAYNKTNRFAWQLFELRKMGLEEKWVVRNNTITDITFNNTIIAGCLCGEFEQLAGLLPLGQKYLPPQIRQDVLFLAKANIEHYQKRYIQSLTVLSKIEKTTLTIDFKSRVLRVKNLIHLLQKGDDSADYYGEIVQHATLGIKFLQRDKTRSKILNNKGVLFFKISKQIAITIRNKSLTLTRHKAQLEAKRIQKIKTRIAENNILSQKWLLAQLALVKN